MESTGRREAEILTTDYTDERGSGIGAETQKLRKADGEHREPSKCGMRAPRTATTGDCGMRNAECGLGDTEQPFADCEMHEMMKGRSGCGTSVCRAKSDPLKPIKA